MAISAAPQSLAVDARALESLRGRATSDPQGALREAARQFEALFMQELVKSMRSTTMASGWLDNAGSQMGEQMLDTQFAGALSGQPGGLSEAILRQLERQMGLAPGPIPQAMLQTVSQALTPPGSARPVRIPQTAAADFVQQHGDAARSAERATGIPAAFMLAQAAHETGWGQKPIRHADGSPSHNLFGIKAGPGWKGPVAEITTTEVVDGQAHKVKAKFRAYASPAESFADYARMMRNSPRYAGMVADTAALAASTSPGEAASTFAQGLQRAGYATDPAYADKLTRVINTTLQLQRSTG